MNSRLRNIESIDSFATAPAILCYFKAAAAVMSAPFLAAWDCYLHDISQEHILLQRYHITWHALYAARYANLMLVRNDHVSA